MYYCGSVSPFVSHSRRCFPVSTWRFWVSAACAWKWRRERSNPAAIKILALRKDFNFLLATILWGNVAINVLLTLLSKSVMAGVTAFLFSTVLITFVGEIMPQAYFSRHAMRMGSMLAPVIRFYQWLLYPVAQTQRSDARLVAGQGRHQLFQGEGFALGDPQAYRGR